MTYFVSNVMNVCCCSWKQSAGCCMH